nr:MAG TPA: hypothetical protein [Caudoviricetes sp.]
MISFSIPVPLLVSLVVPIGLYSSYLHKVIRFIP